jgi:hypothetical protein
MKTFMKLTIACIILTTVFTDKVIINPFDWGRMALYTDKSNEVPFTYAQGTEFPVKKLTFDLPDMANYDWQRRGNIELVINNQAPRDIPQSDLNDLFNFLSENYHVSAEHTKISFSKLKTGQKHFDFMSWDPINRIVGYLRQEQAMFGYLYVLLDCKKFVSGKRSLDRINFEGTDVDVKILQEFVDSECDGVDDFIRKIEDSTRDAVNDLYKEVYELDNPKKSAKRRIETVVYEIKERTLGRGGRSTLLFLE